VSNVLSEEKKKQIIALGQLGWSLRRIEKATGVRRENGRRVSQGRRYRRAAAGRMGQGSAGKTGQWGDHRLRTSRNGKTGQ